MFFGEPIEYIKFYFGNRHVYGAHVIQTEDFQIEFYPIQPLIRIVDRETKNKI